MIYLSALLAKSYKRIGATRLGYFGLSGLTCRPLEKADEKVKYFSGLMNNFPVMTNSAFRQIREKEELWHAAQYLFEYADNLSLAEFECQAGALFRGSGLSLKSMPNNHLGLVSTGDLKSSSIESMFYRQARKKFYSLKHLVLKMLGLDPSKLSEPEIKALLKCGGNISKPITGRLTLEDLPKPIQWVCERKGRIDWHISRKLLELNLNS